MFAGRGAADSFVRRLLRGGLLPIAGLSISLDTAHAFKLTYAPDTHERARVAMPLCA